MEITGWLGLSLLLLTWTTPQYGLGIIYYSMELWLEMHITTYGSTPTNPAIPCWWHAWRYPLSGEEIQTGPLGWRLFQFLATTPWIKYCLSKTGDCTCLQLLQSLVLFSALSTHTRPFSATLQKKLWQGVGQRTRNKSSDAENRAW